MSHKPVHAGRQVGWRRPLRALAAIVAAVWVTALLPGAAWSASDSPGSQGTNTALPPTDSAVTVSAASVLGQNSPFHNLKITVNQTRNLVNQAISVTWSGGTPTNADLGGFNGTFQDNFLQIFECWGNPDNFNPANPGPPPDQCEFGATPEPGTSQANTVPASSLPNDLNSRWLLHSGGKWVPFKSVNGDTIPVQSNSNANAFNSIQYWLNPYFNFDTTNEDDFGLTEADGSGSEFFTADTGLEATGLGCGQQGYRQPDGTFTIPKCWLVIVPRGSATVENLDGCSVTACGGVDTSPLSPSAWKNRIAVPLDFNPIGSSCAIGANERRIVGSELATPAVTNWQPVLCATPGAPPYQYASISDNQARQQLTSAIIGAPGMGVISQPLDPSTVPTGHPIVYAPLTLSGVVIGFNIQRTPKVSGAAGYDPAEDPLRGVQLAHVYLTPRLVAKLLTESYLDQFFELGISGVQGYDWVKKNPLSLVNDPDFLQFNPEFKKLQTLAGAEAGGLVVEQPTSDAAYELWQWILSDREARGWLSGQPDPWGMQANPLYTITADTNPTGAPFGTPTPDNYPKSDPYQFQSGPVQTGIVPRPLSMQDVMPYANSMQLSAQETRTASDGSAIGLNQSALFASTAWTKVGPQKPGNRFILSVTDSADAAAYGLQTASLSRSGDDRTNRTFVAPDQSGLAAGGQAMVASATPGVIQANVSATATGAYPLPTLTYAAVIPSNLDTSARHDYAKFITYAAGPGQTLGTKFGNLPPGYVPLSAALRAQALAAAQAILTSPAASPAAGGTPATGAAANSASGTSRSGQGTGTANSNSAGSGAGSHGGSAGAGSTTVPGSGSAVSGTPNGAPSAQVSLAGSRSRTPAQLLGAVRYVLPIALALGIGCALAARWLGIRRRPGSTSAPPAP
jgi:hypothetical protein